MTIASNQYVGDPAIQCQGKRQFSNKRKAKLALRRVAFKLRMRQDELHAYRCPHCGGYHLGTKPQFAYKKGHS